MDIQYTSFLPECYSTKEFIMGANSGACPPYKNDRTLKSEHTCNILSPPPAIKKMMRETILKHEAAFRDQVRELHRVYRRQRELMDEIGRGEISVHELQFGTFQSKPFISQNSFKYPDRTWQIHSMPWVNPAGCRPSVANAEKLKASSNLFNREGLAPIQAERSLEDCKLLEHKCKNSKRLKLDLELLADQYICSEEGESLGEKKAAGFSEGARNPPKGMLEVLPKSDLELLPCEGLFNSVNQGGAFTHAFSRRSNDVASMNESIGLKDAATPSSANFIGSDTDHRQILCWDLDRTAKLNSGFQVLSKEVFLNVETQRKIETPKVINLDKDRQWQPLPPKYDTGHGTMNLSFYPGKLPMSANSLHAEVQTQLPRVNQFNNSDGKLWSDRTNYGFETCKRNDVTSDNYPGLTASFKSTTCQLVSQSDVAKPEPASSSSQRKAMHSVRQNPIEVQALPCFNVPVQLIKSSKSSLGGSALNGNNFHLSRNSRCSPSGWNLSHDGNSFYHLNCNSVNSSASKLKNPTKYAQDSGRNDENSAKGVDLNVVPPSYLLDTAGTPPKFGAPSGVKKVEELFGGLPWLQAKPDYNGKPKEIENLTHINSGILRANMKFLYDIEPKGSQTTDCLSTEISFGSSNFGKPHVRQVSAVNYPPSSYLSPCEEKDISKSTSFGKLDSNLAQNPASNTGEHCTVGDPVEIRVQKMLSGVGNQIDLNSCINEDDLSVKQTVPIVVMKSVEEIDLEAPVSPENKESSPPRGKLEKNHLEEHLQLPKQEDRDPPEELINRAAEVLVEISSFGLKKSLEDAACEPSEPCPADSLHWFATLVSSQASTLEKEMGVVLSSDLTELSCGSDSFELMTLKLTETVAEEYCCWNNGQKEEETEEILSPSRPRRGLLRKGRIQKDFQTDVLPSLASLSRHEVKRDLQTIGGLMEAAGTHLVAGSGRRNGGKNGSRKARKRSSVSPPNVIGSTLCSPLKQQSNDCTSLAFGTGILIGWGKKNRRRRGHRFPASNPSAIFC